MRTELDNQRYRDRRAAGLCVDCGKPTSKKPKAQKHAHYAYCDECRKADQEHFALLKRNGICKTCGGETRVHEDGSRSTYCTVCLRNNRAYFKMWPGSRGGEVRECTFCRWFGLGEREAQGHDVRKCSRKKAWERSQKAESNGENGTETR